jgi:phage terminase large subunit-like protein
MTKEQLASWFTKHRLDKNYQYRSLTDVDFKDAAEQSWNRLLAEHKVKFGSVAVKFGGFIASELELLQQYRFLAQTNLFALCKLLETYKDMSDREYVWMDGTTHTVHESICNDFFVQKDPTQKTFKSFATSYIGKKERLLLVPRGGFKSSMDMADCVQYIACWPEVTILVLTGVLALANDFVGEIKGHFTLEDGGDSNLFGKKPLRPRTMSDGSVSMFQVLFPEHCIAPDDGKSSEYQTPAVSVKEKEPTVFAASIEQNLTGWHVGVLKLDDVVTNENSQTLDRMKNINKQVSINQAMLHPYGFYDLIGTWYDLEDVYGQIIKNHKKFEEDGEDFPTKIYIRAAWWMTEESRLAGKITEEMQEGDYGYWFNDSENPHALTFKFLNTKRKTDPYFAIKYLNDPTQMHVIKFPRELLIRKTVNAVEVPGTGMIVTTVDTAYSTKSWADYTVILTALIYGGRFYIIDMKRGRYDEYTLPAMIAATAQQWKPKRICIEETGAIKYIQRETYREMDKLQIRVPIELVGLGQGNKTKSKMMKAGPVLRFLGDDRLKFVNSCPGLDELYDELSKFGTASSTHDDIVDALAILVNQFGSYADVEAKMTASSLDYQPDPKGKSFYDQVYGLGQYSKFNIKNAALEFPEIDPSTIVKQAAEDAAYAAYDPLHDLME